MKSVSSTSNILLIICTLLSCYNINAFVVQSTLRPSVRLNAQNEKEVDQTCDRRKALVQGFNLALGIGAVVTSSPDIASASYSAYVNREKDWEGRQKTGDVKISTARDLRSQLREIAPQNEASYKFCPNGPSSAVSPLMENRCGDRLATPSVFGRSDDITGNSIPGLANGRYPSGVPGGTGSLSANPEVGGFPKY